MNMYQTLKNGDVYFNVNRMISFFGTTSYITEETWGYIAILIVNTLGMDNKEETLLYYYQKMVAELKEKNIKFGGYKRKISQVVPTLTRIYGKNTFCWLEISFSLIRSMNSWFSFRNRTLCNSSGPQLSWEFLSELERKYPNIDTDEVIDLLRNNKISSSLTELKSPSLSLFCYSPTNRPFYRLSIEKQKHTIAPSSSYSDLVEERKESFFYITAKKLVKRLCLWWDLKILKLHYVGLFPNKTKTYSQRREAIMTTNSLRKTSFLEGGKCTIVYMDIDSQLIGDFYPER